MSPVQTLPVLAEAADVLSDQLQVMLRQLAVLMRPESDRLESRFLARLEKLNFDVRQRRALATLTLGAAARFLARGCPPADFLEEVDYNGRRLAKLNLPPSAIVVALGEYEKLLGPVLKKLIPAEAGNFQWVREQLQFCVMLTLNNAYYQVRETETQAFYEMFWAELESKSLDELMERLLAILARFCRADEAHLYLWETSETGFVRRACFGAAGGSISPPKTALAAKLRKKLSQPSSFTPGSGAGAVLGEHWDGQYATCWSVPLISNNEVAGVLQFGFLRHYDWLPREQELLTAAAERCLKAAEKARLVEDLAQQQEQIRMLAERMIHVEESERRRISRELHDQAGQDLLCIRLQMEMIEHDLPEEEGGWKSRLGDVRDLTERTIVEIRRLIAALSPAVLEQLGLAAAIRQLVTRFRQRHTSKVKLQVGRLTGLPKNLEVIAYRLVQECLNNIVKHSYCSNVNISVSTADGILRLYVEDDGVGFHLEEALNKPESFGLAGIRERVALLGGHCSIQARIRDTEKDTGKVGNSRAKVKPDSRMKVPRGASLRASSGTRICVELPLFRAIAVGSQHGKIRELVPTGNQG
ncbi:MAG: GAF domain-containing sensor histidine kinase [Acidobacteriia bacterium]|nr:GAF domain-containing sensor histidine kinase [Terriglobia bacterium]